MSIIAITGRKGSGKDTIASVLIQHLGYRRILFAAPLKDMLRTLLLTRGCSAPYIERCIEGDLKEQSIPELNGKSPRHAMQTLGTEWGRNLMSETLWTEAWKDATRQTHLVVTPDLRFPNEEEVAREMGAMIIKVVRPSLDTSDSHPSEKFIDAIEADITYINDYPSAEAFQAFIRSDLLDAIAA